MELESKFDNLIERSAHFMKVAELEFKGNRVAAGEQVIAIRVEDIKLFKEYLRSIDKKYEPKGMKEVMGERAIPVTSYKTLYGVEA